MALGNLKGSYPENVELKEKYLHDISNLDHVLKIGKFGNIGFWIKIKDYKYKYHFMQNRMVTPKPIPFERGKEEIHYEGNYFIVQTVGKYFHDILENLPQILTLKKAGEQFKVLLLSNQPIDPETNMFYGMSNTNDKGYQQITYWRDILKYFDIEYQCVNAKSGDRFSTNSNYVFYYTDYGSTVGTGLGGPGTFRIKSLLPNLAEELYLENSYYIMPLFYFTTWIHADAYDMLNDFIKPLISDVVPGKRIFITRDTAKFADRSIENSKELTDYMREQGFDIFNQEDYLWPEQIKIITSAESIVSLVGSGFINAMFCGPGTTMISIHTDKSQDFVTYANQAGRTDSDFKTVYCDPDGLDIIEYLKNSKSKITRKVMDGGN